MGNVVVYHFEMPSARQPEQSVSRRPATREAIEALGFTPLMQTAQIVDRSRLDGSGFVRGDQAGE
jgi:hypothetical protein